MNLAVTINTKNNPPKFLCVVEEDKIDELLKMILLECHKDYGKEQVLISEVEIFHSMTKMYPSMHKVCKIECNTGVDKYEIWVEFHKKNLEDLDISFIRKIIM